MVLVFDLDDTLYDELTFVQSGFDAVSAYVHSKYKVRKNTVFTRLNSLLINKGRGVIFNDMLEELGVFSKKEVQKCLSVYRLHKPKIHLWPEANDCLKRFKKIPLYIVSDGNKIVQYNKIKALRLATMVDKYYITHQYGIAQAKPSPYCFLKIAEKEKEDVSNIVYIGDNIRKDFVGIKPLGFRTLRVKTGQYVNVKKEKKFEAEYQINNLSELTENLLKNRYGYKNW